MSTELEEFTYFKNYCLLNFNRITGQLDTKNLTGTAFYYNVGSENDDGYVRIRIGKKLRMKHRLIYFLIHNKLPDVGYEIDHKNNTRNDNRPSNIHAVPKAINNTGCANRKFGSQFSKETIIKICELLANTNLSDLTIAKQTNTSRGTVRDIKTRRSRLSISEKYQWPHRIK